jgi:uncharacterized membrane protein YciS (DUF1049 family)
LDPANGLVPNRLPFARRRFIAGAVLLAGSLGAQTLAHLDPLRVEALFSEGLYPRFGGLLGTAAGVLPFSLAEALVVGALALVAIALARALVLLARGQARLSSLLAAWVANGAVLGGVAYALFLVSWGFNYARPALATLLGLSRTEAPSSELAELGADLVRASNRERQGLPEDAAGALRIDGGFASVARRVQTGFTAARATLPIVAVRGARPKPVFLSPLLSRLGITGIYFPFTGEPNVNTTLPDSELPFSAAHEVAHQQGFAREDEANYVGYLACRHHPDADFRYAGLLAASHYVLSALHAVDPAAAAEIQGGRSPEVLRDEAVLRAWITRYRGRANEVGRRVNDAYLRSQGQTEGVRSYGRMVDLLLAERRATTGAH